MRIALGIEYDGNGYFGWQRQAEVDSVQGQLERALSIVANEPIGVFCAGRTDAGVHATGQVVHFETNAIRNEGAWTLGVNANLPDNIAHHVMQESIRGDINNHIHTLARYINAMHITKRCFRLTLNSAKASKILLTQECLCRLVHFVSIDIAVIMAYTMA